MDESQKTAMLGPRVYFNPITPCDGLQGREEQKYLPVVWTIWSDEVCFISNSGTIPRRPELFFANDSDDSDMCDYGDKINLFVSICYENIYLHFK